MFDAEPEVKYFLQSEGQQAASQIRRPEIRRTAVAAMELSRSRLSADPGRQSGDSPVRQSTEGKAQATIEPDAKAMLHPVRNFLQKKDEVGGFMRLPDAPAAGRLGPSRQSSRDITPKSVLSSSRASSTDPAGARASSRGAANAFLDATRQSNDTPGVQFSSREVPPEAQAGTCKSTGTSARPQTPTNKDALTDAWQRVMDLAIQSDEAPAKGITLVNGGAAKGQLQLAMNRVAAQAREIAELRTEANAMQECRVESRETARELQQLRAQLESMATEQSVFSESDLGRANELCTFQAEEIEELRTLQKTMAPLSELQQVQAQCDQLAEERELIRQHVDRQQAKWDEALQSNRDEVASMLRAFEKDQTTKASLTCELEVAREQARRAEQAQHTAQLEASEELEHHRTSIAAESALSMVEMQSHLQQLADRQAAIDDLTRERSLALVEMSQIEAQSAQVAAEAECVRRNAEENQAKKAKRKKVTDPRRFEVASLLKSLEAERTKHSRMAEELQAALQKVTRAEQDNRCIHARREEALQEREAEGVARHEEMQDFMMHLAARQRAIDDLSSERNAALEQVLQIEAQSAHVTAQTKVFQRDIAETAAKESLAHELRAALEQAQVANKQSEKDESTTDLSDDELQNLAKRLEMEKGANAVLTQEFQAASKQLELERQANVAEAQAHAQQLAEQTSAKEQISKERAALEKVSRAAVVERDRIQREYEEQKSKMATPISPNGSKTVEVASLAKDLAAEKAANQKLVKQLDDATEKTSKAERDLDTLRAERERALQQLQVQDNLRKERDAALEQASQADAKCAQLAAETERDRIQRDVAQRESKIGTSARDEVASLSKSLESEKAAKSSLVKQLDAAMEQTFQLEREKDQIRAEREKASQELQDHRTKMAQKQKETAAELQIQARQLEERKSAEEALRKERAAALEQVSSAEAKLAQSVAERDRIKQELADQKTKMESKEASSPKSPAPGKIQLDTAVERASRAEKERDKMRAEREKALQDLRAQRAQMTQEREAAGAEIKAHAKQIEEHTLAKDDLRKERAAALEQVSKVEAQCAQTASERDSIRSELSQAKMAITTGTKQDEVASLARELTAERALKQSLVKQLDDAMEQTFQVERERDTLRADRERVAQELQVQADLQKEIAAEKDRIQCEISPRRAILTKTLEAEKAAKASLLKELDDAIEQTFEVEKQRDKIQAERGQALQELRDHRTKIAQEKEEKDRIKRAFDEQQARLAALEKRLEEQTRNDRLAKEQVTTLERASFAEQLPSKEVDSDKLLGLEKGRPQRDVEEPGAKLDQVSDSPSKEIGSLLKRFEEEKASREVLTKDFEANLERLGKRLQPEAKSTSSTSFKTIRSSADDRIGGAIKVPAAAAAAKPALADTAATEAKVSATRATAAPAAKATGASIGAAASADSAATEVQPATSTVEDGTRATTAPAVKAATATTAAAASADSAAKEVKLATCAAVDRKNEAQSGTAAKLAAIFGPSPRADQKTQSTSSAVSKGDPQARSTLQLPSKSTGSQANAASRNTSQPPGKATASQGDALSRSRSQSPGKVVGSQSDTKSRNTSQSPSKAAVVQDDPQSSSASAVSLSKPIASARSTSVTPSSTASTLFPSKPIASARSASVTAIGSRTGSTTGSATQTKGTDSEVSTNRPAAPPAPPALSLQGKAQQSAHEPLTASSKSTSSIADKTTNGGGLSGLTQTRANIQKLHERLSANASTSSPKKPEVVAIEDSPPKDPDFGKPENPTSPTSATEDSTSPSKRSVSSGASAELQPRRAVLESSHKPEMPPLSFDKLRKGSQSSASRGSLPDSGCGVAEPASASTKEPSDSQEQDTGERRSVSASNRRAKAGHWGLGLTSSDTAPAVRPWLDASLPAPPSPASPSTPSSLKARLASTSVPVPARAETSPTTKVQSTAGMKISVTPPSGAATAPTTAPGTRHTTPISGRSGRVGSTTVPSTVDRNSSPKPAANILLTTGTSGVTTQRAGSSPDPKRSATTLTPPRSAGTPTTPAKKDALSSAEQRAGLPPRPNSVAALPGGVSKPNSGSGVVATVSGGVGGTTNGTLQSTSPPYAFGSSGVRPQDQ